MSLYYFPRLGGERVKGGPPFTIPRPITVIRIWPVPWFPLTGDELRRKGCYKPLNPLARREGRGVKFFNRAATRFTLPIGKLRMHQTTRLTLNGTFHMPGTASA